MLQRYDMAFSDPDRNVDRLCYATNSLDVLWGYQILVEQVGILFEPLTEGVAGGEPRQPFNGAVAAARLWGS